MRNIINKVDKVNPFKVFTDESAKSEVLPYSYPCENYISIIVSNPVAKYALKKFFDSHIKQDIEKIERESIAVDKKKFPRIYGVLQTCCQKLKISKAPKVMVSNRLRGVNSITIGTDSNPVVLISPMAISSLNNAELSFLIGHELGHIAQRNLICHTVKGALDTVNKWSDVLGPIISDTIEVPLNKWYRCSEYTSDRAGVICCGDFQVAVNLLNNVSLKTNHATTTPWDSYQELSCDHPTIQNRIEELKKIAKNTTIKDSFRRYSSSIQ